jgi:hypothetical protein
LGICPLLSGSGKLDTPWERMQLEKRTSSCCVRAPIGWPELDPLGELGEFEPHAAITVAAAIAAAATGRHVVSLNMVPVVAAGRSQQCNTQRHGGALETVAACGGEDASVRAATNTSADWRSDLQCGR